MTAAERRLAKETFLKALGNTANVRAACFAAGIDSSTVYRWQEHDDDFAQRFREENTSANWLLFGECWRRVMIGEERYVVSKGGAAGRASLSDEFMRLLAWDLAGSALAYADWDGLVALLTGRAQASENLFTLTLYNFTMSDGGL